jgi:glycosyltransferase involved in cell wall biosynthesis
MCGALVARGHYVEIYTTNLDGDRSVSESVAQPLFLNGVRTTYYRTQRPRSYATSVPMALALRRRITDFDVVHVHSLYLFHTLVATALSRRRKVPYVLRPHGTLDPYHRSIHRWRKALYDALIERRNLAAAAAIHYTSRREREFAEETGVRAPGYVIPHGIDTAAFDEAVEDDALASWLPEVSGKVIITFLGRLTEKKGLDVLCSAFAQTNSAERNVHLVIAGPDDEGIGARVRQWVSELGIEDKVSLPGLVTGSAKIELLRRSTIFVLPSSDENFGLSVAEALAARTAAVVTPGVAIQEEIEAADAGLVVERNAEAVSRALTRLLRDPNLRGRLADNGRALIERSYAWDRIGAKLEDMYRTIVDEETFPKAVDDRRLNPA